VLHERRDIGEGELSRQPALLEEGAREVLMVSAALARLEGPKGGDTPELPRIILRDD
jgi:hypothetical protein